MSSLPFALKRKDAFIIMMLYSPSVVGEFITALFQNYMINDNLHTCVKMCTAINELINRRWYSESVKFYERYHWCLLVIIRLGDILISYILLKTGLYPCYVTIF